MRHGTLGGQCTAALIPFILTLLCSAFFLPVDAQDVSNAPEEESTYDYHTEDDDGDGTLNGEDDCPSLSGDWLYNGCPDDDWDGYPETEEGYSGPFEEDLCPSEYGEYSGCPYGDESSEEFPVEESTPYEETDTLDDSDGDGVDAAEDVCPSVFGDAVYYGCPDSDADGYPEVEGAYAVPFDYDQCPAEYGEYFGCDYSDETAEDGETESSEEEASPEEQPEPEETAHEEQTQTEPVDSDGDGSSDSADECPTTPGDPFYNGCPDNDADGYPETEAVYTGPSSPDLCVEEYGWNDGCPTEETTPDADNDGIADQIDRCPDRAGDPFYEGCPDNDGDGVPENVLRIGFFERNNPPYTDLCPDTYGWIDGCPDADGDGFPETELGIPQDRCPTVAGPMNGCPIGDDDGDGIQNEDDDCPTLFGESFYHGCLDEDHDGYPELEYVGSTPQHIAPEMVDQCFGVYGHLSGCPDADNDFFPESEEGEIPHQDRCPGVPGTESGCPIGDNDEDGVLDPDDICDCDAGDALYSGCPDADSDGFPEIIMTPEGESVGDLNWDRCPDVYGWVEGCPDADGDFFYEFGSGYDGENAKDFCPAHHGNDRGCDLPHLRALVRQMGHENFRERQAAYAALFFEIQQAVDGTVYRDILREGANSGDAEIAARCRRLNHYIRDRRVDGPSLSCDFEQPEPPAY